METHTVITEKKERASYTDLFLRTIAVIGLVAVLILGAWGIIQLAIAIPGLFSSNGSSTGTTTVQKNSLSVTSPSSIFSGQTAQVSWALKNPATAQYSYTISYACQNGLTLNVPVPTGSYNPVPCNTPFNYVNASAHMTVVPVITGTESVPLVLTVNATLLSSGTVVATGTSTTLVTPSTPTKPATTKPAATKPAAKPSSSQATTYYPAATRAALFGYPDLAVTVTSVAPSGSRTTVQFTIANVGTNIVNSGWTFNASLPINGSYTFASQPQQALYPGDKIVYNLSFDNTYGTSQYPTYGNSGYTTGGYTCNGYNCTPPSYTGYQYSTGYSIGTVTITADPFGYIMETNKGNNSASATTPVY